MNTKYWLTAIFIIIYSHLYAQEWGTEYHQIFQNIVRQARIEEGKVKLELERNADALFTSKNDSIWVISIGMARLQSLPKNLFTLVVCHEIGHVLKNHSGEPGFNQEQEADSTCGYWMRYLNFEASDFMPYLAFFLPGETKRYGTEEQRYFAFLKGWNHANSMSLKIEYASNLPRIIWYMENDGKLVVHINSRKLIFETYYNHGLIYDSLTNSTFELLDWNGSEGIGRFVTNRSLFTYRIYRNGNFSIYRMGEELTFDECKKARKLEWEGKDAVFGPCNDDVAFTDLEFIFSDCDLVPYEYAMPAESRPVQNKKTKTKK